MKHIRPTQGMKHGKKQPQSLRDMLNNNNYESIAKKIKSRKGIAKLHIPIEQISTELQENAKK